MGGGSNLDELAVEQAGSARSRFPLSRRAKAGPAADSRARPLRVTTFGCEPAADLAPQALGLTYWFDTAAEGKPYPVTIRFAGRRIGVKGKPGPRDTFSVTESIGQVVPGSGPIAITTRMLDVAPGEWHVTATPVIDSRPRSATPRSVSARRPSLPKASSSGTTAFAPVVRVRAPGAHLGTWPALVGLGVAVALTTQAALAARSHLHVTRVLLLSLVAGVPAGALLDLTAPGLLFGMTIGRFGCFFGGCCVGKPTASRWGLWSSDQRLGMRRFPTQLLESALTMIVGSAALLAVLTTTPKPAGAVFIGTIAAYTFGRQLLFPLRNRPHTARGRALTMALAGLVLAVDLAFAAVAK